MVVGDILRTLSLGEFNNLALSNGGDGTVRTEDRDRLIGYINEALVRLYSRFYLREKDVLIEMVEWITNYHLDSKFAVSNPDPIDPKYPRYIKDLEYDPFRNDVVKILSVREAGTHPLPLNERERPDSLFTPAPNILQIPRPIEGLPVSIQYQALHPALPLGVLTTPVDLPPVLYGALRSLVAWQQFMHMNTQETSAKSQEHYASYERQCQEVELADAANASNSSRIISKFHMNGWV